MHCVAISQIARNTLTLALSFLSLLKTEFNLVPIQVSYHNWQQDLRFRKGE